MFPFFTKTKGIVMLKKISLLLFCCFFLMQTGCSIYMAAFQPGVKNVELLKIGTPREELIAEFGEPVISGIDADGREYDKFSFTQGYSAGIKFSRAVFHAVAEISNHCL